MSTRANLAPRMDLAAAAIVLIWLALALVSRGDAPPLATGLTLLAASFVPGLWFFAHARAAPAADFPLVRLLLWAAAFRAIGLAGAPLWEDDYFRYLWDGYRFYADGTPYAAAPAAWFGDASVPAAMQRVLDGVNYPDVPTLYGPVAQGVFLTAHALAPGALWPLQTLLAAADLALVVVLARIAPLHWVWLYAASPLVFKEIALSVHPDGLMTLALALALLARARGATVAVALAAAVAVAAKIVALVAVPFLLARLGVRAGAVFGVALAALYLPFALHGAGFAGLAVMARDWEFNAGLYLPAAALFGATPAKLALGAAYVAGAAWAWRGFRRQPPTALPNLAVLFGALLAIAPVVNPWYALWVLPFAVLHPARWAWVGAAALLAAYVHGAWLPQSGAPYVQPVWLHAAIWGVIAAAVLADITRPLVFHPPVKPPCPRPA